MPSPVTHARLRLLAWLLLAGHASRAAAAVTDYRIVSWNLQGASAATESKWRVHVRQLLDGAGAANIVALQEAGAPPASARHVQRHATAAGIPVDEYEWNLGTRTRPRLVHIYFADTDVGAHRVNLALVTDRLADEVLLLPRVRPYPARPVLGVRIGNDFVLTTHALRRQEGGNDAGALVQTVVTHFAARAAGLDEWILLADFNLPPATLTDLLHNRFPAARAARVVTQPLPTQVCGRVLDYALLGRTAGWPARTPTANLFVAQLHGQLASDHMPVLFAAPR